MEHIPRNSEYHPANIYKPGWFKTKGGLIGIAVFALSVGHAVTIANWKNIYFYDFDHSNKGKRFRGVKE